MRSKRRSPSPSRSPSTRRSPYAARGAWSLAAQSAHDDELWQVSDEAQAVAAKSDDFKEGVAAFVEKRAPRWTGR